jgi:hypothetical protein
MGLFSSFKKVVKKVAKPFVRALPRAIRTPVTKVSTSLSKLTPSTLLKYASQGPVLGPINFVAKSTAPKIAPYIQLGSTIAASFVNPGNLTSLTGAAKMGINLGGLLGNIGNILGSTNATGNQYVGGLSTALQISGSLVNSARPAAKAPAMRPMTPAARPAAVAAVAVSARGITREIFNAGSKVLSRLGISYSASSSGFSSALRRSLGSIASLARRTPAGTIVNILLGLGLTALEANMLTAWYAQRKKGRRMNPANSRALRRAARRIKAFHRLCVHTDVIKSRHRRVPSRAAHC